MPEGATVALIGAGGAGKTTAPYSQREGVPGALKLQIVPEAPLAFFRKAMDARVRFTTDAGGRVTGASVTDRSKRVAGRRLPP